MTPDELIAVDGDVGFIAIDSSRVVRAYSLMQSKNSGLHLFHIISL